MNIIDKAEEYRQQFRGAGYHITSMDIKEAFEDGAEWMQKKMIDKATQWLFENVYDYTNPEDQERVEAFRKYLEE